MARGGIAIFFRDRRQTAKANDQKPLTLTLSRRERGLTAVNEGDVPTWETESNSSPEPDRDLANDEDLLPFPSPPMGERAGVRGIDSGNHT